MLLPVSDFTLSLTQTQIDLSKLSKEMLENMYPLTNLEEEEESTDFIIYPEEYSNSELLKQKYIIDINSNIFKLLLKANNNPYILDSNGQSAIYPVLKIHNHKIINEMKNDLDYREFTDIAPFLFLLNEHKNHTFNLTGKTNNFNDWLKNFTMYQMNEVKVLLSSNEKYANNFPRYLSESFSVVAYMTIQYLSETIYKLNDDEIKKEIFRLFNLDSDMLGKYLYLNQTEVITPLKIYINDNNNIKKEILDNKKKELTKIKEKESKLKNNLSKDKETAIESLINKLSAEIKDIEDSLKEEDIENGGKMMDNKKLLDRYNNFNSLGKLLSDFIRKADLNKSKDLILLNMINEEREILNNFKPSNAKLCGLELLNKLYEHINKKSEIYFTFGKYADDNHVLEFVKELLEFATKNFIMYSYRLVIRNIIAVYLLNIGEIDIENKIDSLFKLDILFENKYQSIEKILDNIITPKIVQNCVGIFDNVDQEMEFTNQSVKELLDSVVEIFTIHPLFSIPYESAFYKNMKEINSYFDTFIQRSVINWQVVIENIFKFNINQGRIIKSIYNLVK